MSLEKAERDLGDAIGGVLRGHGLMANRWTLVCEVLDDEGQRQLVSFTSSDLRVWDSLGMLGYIHERERGAVHAEVAAERDDEGG